jgi:hypothetical protein
VVLAVIEIIDKSGESIMPKKPASGNGKEWQEDALVKDLLQGSTEVLDFVVLVGWMGKSAQEGYWRLYLSPDLSDYIEFHQDDVVRRQAAPPELAIRGSTLIWLRTEQIQSAFLQGELTEDMWAASDAAETSARSGRRRNIWYHGRPDVRQLSIDLNCRLAGIMSSIRRC